MHSKLCRRNNNSQIVLPSMHSGAKCCYNVQYAGIQRPGKRLLIHHSHYIQKQTKIDKGFILVEENANGCFSAPFESDPAKANNHI